MSLVVLELRQPVVGAPFPSTVPPMRPLYLRKGSNTRWELFDFSHGFGVRTRRGPLVTRIRRNTSVTVPGVG